MLNSRGTLSLFCVLPTLIVKLEEDPVDFLVPLEGWSFVRTVLILCVLDAKLLPTKDLVVDQGSTAYVNVVGC